MRIERNKVIAGSLITITTLSTALLTLPSVLADDGFIDVVTIDVPVSCSLSSSGMTSHNKTIQNGNTENEIGTTNIKVTCNDNTGYALYAIGYTNDEYGNNKLTSTTLGSTHDIITSTTITTGTSSWAMKLANTGSTYLPIIAGSTDDTNKQTGDPDFSGYTEVPNEYTKVAYFPSSTDIGSGASGSNLTTTYRAYISQTQPAGTYIGQVKYTLVHPSTAGKPVTPLKASDCPAGYVCYAPNASDIEGSMSSLGSISSSPTAGKISVGTSATTINLIAPNYKREGYGFAGWSTDFTATNASTIYGPNETLTVPSTTLATKGMILYPVWIAPTGTFQGTNNQGWTGCSSLTAAPSDGTRATLASMTALTDTRDNNVYTVARLADGKCWMVENLRLDNEATISTSNTHNPLNTNGTVNLKIDYANGTTANHLASTSDSWCKGDGAACLDQTMLNTNNTNIGGKNASNTDLIPGYNTNTATAQWYGYGNYYNWYSATAGNGIRSFNTNDDSVSGDLCPAGWHLPQGGQAYAEGDTSGVNVTNDPSTYRDFYNLGYTLVGTTAYENTPNIGNAYYNGSNYSNLFRTFPNNFVYSGGFYDSSANNRGSYGYYWSSSADRRYYAYYLLLGSSLVFPGTSSSSRYYGYSVRCISQ